MTKFTFIGGHLAERCRDEISKDSLGGVQSAADVYQSGLVAGLRMELDGRLRVVSLPFIGSFPLRYRRAWFGGSDVREADLSILTLGFLNLPAIKHLWRAVHLLVVVLRKVGAGGWVIVYSADPALVLPLAIGKWLRGFRVCIVLPDFPNHYGGGLLQTIYHRGAWFPIRRLIKNTFNAFVFLTEQSISYMGVPRSNSVVIEGVYREPALNVEAVSDATNLLANLRLKRPGCKVVLYSGTFDKKYGVGILLEAMRSLPREGVCLLLCGAGDLLPEIVRAARVDSRIIYSGQLNRDVVVELQRRVDVLVNPRSSMGEYTSYSFPSKIIEYFASGAPVVMFKLPGVPLEYYDWCVVPESESASDLAAAICSVVWDESGSARALAMNARDFVVARSCAKSQARRLLELLNSV